MRWLSPPDKVEERRSNVKYPNPTSSRKRRRLFISISKRLATTASCSSNSKWSKKAFASDTGIATSSAMFLPPTRTYNASGFSRAPLQAGQAVLPR